MPIEMPRDNSLQAIESRWREAVRARKQNAVFQCREEFNARLEELLGDAWIDVDTSTVDSLYEQTKTICEEPGKKKQPDFHVPKMSSQRKKERFIRSNARNN